MYDGNVNTPFGWSGVAFVLNSWVTHLLRDIVAFLNWDPLAVLSWHIVAVRLLVLVVSLNVEDSF